MVHIGVLGPIEVAVDGEQGAPPAPLLGRRERAVLAMLLVARGSTVSVDRLVDGLWGDSPPPRAVAALQVHVSHLRRVLEPGRPRSAPPRLLRSEAPGYALRLSDDAVDAWRFEHLVAQAADASPAAARADLERALALWRGGAYAEVADRPWASDEVARLEEVRSVARERLVCALLADARSAEAALAAESVVREHPLREEPWRLLALSLYAAGRPADALGALRRARQHLADELGLDPGPGLRDLEQDILEHRVDLPERDVREPRPQVRPGAPPDRARDGFVGRQEQLRALREAATATRTASRTGLVVVHGESGGGKSTLLARAGAELTGDGWRVEHARCAEVGGDAPASAWASIARALAGRAVPPALAPLLEDGGPVLADAASGRSALRHGLAGLVTASARRRPLAILLDDLHRADEATLELLTDVVEEVSEVPLLVVGTTRSTWPGADAPDARSALSALTARADARVDLTGLSAADSAALVRAVTGPQTDVDTVRALVERTGGNPFYLVASAHLLRSEGSLVALSRVPDGVRDVLRRRFDLLRPTTVQVLRRAAVVGREVDVDLLLATASGDPSSGGGPAPPPAQEEAVIAALEEGVRAGLLDEPGPGTVRFAHVVVRETLYDDVPGVRRGRWHARVAAALAELRPDDVAALAHHLYLSGTAAGARAAVDAAEAAAEQATARYAPERAVVFHQRALQALDRLWPEEADAPPEALAERVELLSRCSRAQLAAGAGVAAIETRAEAVRVAERSGDDALLVRALTAWDLPTPWTVRTYGTYDSQLVALLERCLRTLTLDAPRRCRLLCVLVREVAGHDPGRAASAAGEAEALARGAGEPLLVGLALHARGTALLHESDLDARLPLAAELCRIGQEPGLAIFDLIGHEFAVQRAVAHADLPALVEHLERIDALVATYRWRQAAAVVAMHHGVLAHITGDLGAAREQYARAASTLRRNGGLDAGWITAIAAFSLAVTRGRPGDLLPLLADLRPYPPMTVDLVAVVLAASGRRDEARTVRRSAPPIGHDFFRSLRLTGRALAVLALGATDEAAAVHDDLGEFAGQLGGAVTGAFAFEPVDALRGDLARLLGREDDARAHYAAAAEVAARCGSPAWVAALAERRSRA